MSYVIAQLHIMCSVVEWWWKKEIAHSHDIFTMLCCLPPFSKSYDILIIYLYRLVEETLKPLDPKRRAFRLIGGVLVERTVEEVLPSISDNLKNVSFKNLIWNFKSFSFRFVLIVYSLWLLLFLLFLNLSPYQCYRWNRLYLHYKPNWKKGTKKWWIGK